MSKNHNDRIPRSNISCKYPNVNCVIAGVLGTCRIVLPPVTSLWEMTSTQSTRCQTDAGRSPYGMLRGTYVRDTQLTIVNSL